MIDVFFDICDFVYSDIHNDPSVDVSLNVRINFNNPNEIDIRYCWESDAWYSNIYFNITRSNTELYDWVSYFKDCMTIHDGYIELNEINNKLDSYTASKISTFPFYNTCRYKKYLLRTRDERLVYLEAIEKLENKIENGFNTFLRQNNLSKYIIPTKFEDVLDYDRLMSENRRIIYV